MRGLEEQLERVKQYESEISQLLDSSDDVLGQNLAAVLQDKNPLSEDTEEGVRTESIYRFIHERYREEVRDLSKIMATLGAGSYPENEVALLSRNYDVIRERLDEAEPMKGETA